MDHEERTIGQEPARETERADHERIEEARRRGNNRAKNAVILILALTTLFGAYQFQRAKVLRRQLDAQYNRAFYEMMGYVDNVEIMLSKAMLTSSPDLTAKILKDVWHQAELASTNLGQLPIGQGALSNTQKFISQVGDYAQSLNFQSTKGLDMDGKQTETLENLHKFAVTLEENLDKLQGDLAAGNLKWENLGGQGSKTFGHNSQEMPKSFETIDNSFQEMPTLIYDGPFSEHMTSQKPLGLTGDKISDEQAIEKLKVIFGKDNIRNVKKVSDNKNGTIDTYNFSFELKGKKDFNTAEADVSVIGGKMVWFLYDRDVGEKKLDIDQAKEIGKKFLEKTGFKNMKDTYYTEQQGIATINYAYEEDGITVYADLVKVKVALDNGEVVGFESKGYLMSHRKRDVGKPTITEAQARAKVKRGEDIKSSGLAIIPTDFATELFCYEFKGKLNNKDFIVYINAITGDEEDVLLIINTEEGVLTQ
jgi:spore germination protein